MPSWVWLPELLRYRDLETGQFVSADQVRAWSYAAIDAANNAVAEATTQLTTGLLNVGDWETIIRQELKDAYIQDYVLGRGGLGQMTQADWGSVGGMLSDQYRHLDDFAAEIANGELTAAQIQARTEMYFESATEAYERANARSWGVPVDKLPAMPGDGSTQCITNCRCAWEFEETETGWNCYWKVDPDAESCSDCLARGGEWNPYFIPFEEE